jgi:hypothetical protein
MQKLPRSVKSEICLEFDLLEILLKGCNSNMGSLATSIHPLDPEK